MRHLLNSVVRVEEMIDGRDEDGIQTTSWRPVSEPSLQRLPCRIDLNFTRPGKDAPQPVNAGATPDRIALMFCMPNPHLKAGHRIVTIPNVQGKEPIQGTFEIRSIPDVALGWSDAHHIEVQITEVASEVREALFPGDDDEILSTDPFANDGDPTIGGD